MMNKIKKKVIETFENLSLDPESPNYILKRIGNQTTSIVTEDGQSFVQQTGEFPNKSKNVRIKNLYVKTPNYLKEDGDLRWRCLWYWCYFIPFLVVEVSGGSFNGGALELKMLIIHLIFT